MNKAIIISAFFFACSDYNLQQKKEQLPPAEEPVVEQDPVFPQLVVTPDVINESSVCGSQTWEVSMMNIGEAPLQVDEISVIGSGWNVVPIQTPLVLAPWESTTLTLAASSGSGFLSIISNDPDQPDTWVDLFAAADLPPTVEILSVQDGDIIPVGGQEIEALVFDPEDPAEMLELEWSSSVDGFLSGDASDTQGSARLDFFTGSSGGHEISLRAVDSCGQEFIHTVSVCQQEGYDVENLPIDTWNFEGTSFWDSQNTWVELTGPSQNQGGTAFSTATAVNAENVDIEFLFYVSGGSGADGISVTALDTTRMTGFVGTLGGGMGYGGLPGWSIEVDTYRNGHDPSQDHVAFVFDGNVTSPQVVALLPEMEDNQWHTMRVVVNAPHVLVEIDGQAYIDQNISGHYSFPAYVGFTAATGSLTNYHLIDSLVVTEMVCEE